MLQRVFRTFKPVRGNIPVTVYNFRTDGKVIPSESIDLFLPENADPKKFLEEIAEWASKRFNVPTDQLDFDIDALHQYFRVVTTPNGFATSKVEAIWLTLEEASANDIPYLYETLSDAKKRAEEELQ